MLTGRDEWSAWQSDLSLTITDANIKYGRGHPFAVAEMAAGGICKEKKNG